MKEKYIFLLIFENYEFETKNIFFFSLSIFFFKFHTFLNSTVIQDQIYI